MKSTKARFALSVFFLALAAPVFAGERSDPDEWKTELHRSFPEVPAVRWAEFVKALAGTEAYRLAAELEPGRVREKAKTWAAETGMEIRVQEARFLDTFRRLDCETGDGQFTLASQTFRTSKGMNVHFYALTLRGKQGSPSESHFVPPALLAPLQAPFASQVVLSHPIATRTIEAFEADLEPLSDLVDRLFGLGGVDLGRDPLFDKAVNGGAGSLRISLNVRDADVLECIAIAVDAAGWKIRVNGQTPRQAFHYKSISTLTVLRSGIWGFPGSRTLVLTSEESKSEPEPPPSVIDALRHVVFSEAKKVGEVRFRVVLGP